MVTMISKVARPRAGQSNGSPNRAERKASIIPDMGFSINSQRHFCAIEEEGRMTDETNSHNWMTKGNAKRTSRYLTFSADIHVPTASANSAVSSTSTGSNRMCVVRETL